MKKLTFSWFTVVLLLSYESTADVKGLSITFKLFDSVSSHVALACIHLMSLFLVLRPKWPSSSFVSSDGLVTAMAYRLPHVVRMMCLSLAAEIHSSSKAQSLNYVVTTCY